MRTLILKFISFSVIILVLLKFLDQYYTTYLSNHKNLCEKPNWILNHSNQSFDLAFEGNSRVYNMIDINLIEKKTGQISINLGLTGSNYAENYLVLDQFYKAGNRIKNLVIQIDLHSLNSNSLSYPFHNFFYMHLMKDSIVSEVFKDYTSYYKYNMWKSIPFIRYMEFNNRFILYKMLKGGFECKKSDEFDETKGSVLVSGRVFKSENSIYAYRTINKTDVKYLEKIIDFASKNKINVVMYTAPIYYKCLPYQLNYNEIIQKARMIAANRGIHYFDFSEKTNPLCKDQHNFYDDVHMNSIGVKKFSSTLLDSIKPFLLR